MARWWPVGVLLLALGCGGQEAERVGHGALEEFGQTGTPEGDVLREEMDVRLDAVVPERLWDGLLGLGFLAVLWGIGWLVHGAIPGFRHYLPPALGAAVVVVFLMPTTFFQFRGVRVDREGVTVETQTGGERSIAYRDVRRVFVTRRPLYPRFTDARELVLEDGAGRRVGIPFFVPRRAEVARAVAAGLQRSAPEGVLR